MNDLKKVGIIFTIIGVVFILITGLVTYFIIDAYKNDIRNTGKVVEVVYHKDQFFTHIIEFKSDGEVHRFPSINSYPPTYNPDQLVEVSYDPENPENASTVNFWHTWTVVFIIGGLGFVFFCTGILNILPKRKTNNLILFSRYAYLLAVLIPLGILFNIMYSKHTFKENSETTEGVVVESMHRLVNSTDDGFDENQYLPLITFEYLGNKFKFYGETTNGKEKYKVGDKVPIIFKKDNPANAQIQSFPWTLIIILGIFGAVFGSFGIFIVFMLKGDK